MATNASHQSSCRPTTGSSSKWSGWAMASSTVHSASIASSVGFSRTALVVGAGIGGLSAARALRLAGWQVQVLEQAQRLEPVGAGITLWPNAVRLSGRRPLLVRSVADPVETVTTSG